MDKRLSNALKIVAGLWFLSVLFSLVLIWNVPIPDDHTGNPIIFADEITLMSEIVVHHAQLLQKFEQEVFDPRSDKELDTLEGFLKHKKRKLRDLALVAIQDEITRRSFQRLRNELVRSYFDIQKTLISMREEEAQDGKNSQDLFKSIRRNLDNQRLNIVETVRELAILPSELELSNKMRSLIFLHSPAELSAQRRIHEDGSG